MTPPDPERGYWLEKLQGLQRGELETVRTAATALTGLTGAVLGIFGVVAFSGGLTGIDKLAAPWDTVVKWVTLAAAVLLAISMVTAALAAQNLSPKAGPSVSWQTLRSETATRARRALRYLRVAMVSAVATAALVLGGSALVLLLGEKGDAPGKPPTLLVVSEGAAACGELTSGAEGLMVGDVSMASAESVTIVGKCP